MKKITTLEEALKRIEKLEKENAELKEANADLKEELEYFKKRKACGRQRHNAKWMAIYNDFVICHEQGMTMVEIAKRNGISERSIYRYKAYYDEMQKKKKGKGFAVQILHRKSKVFRFEHLIDDILWTKKSSAKRKDMHGKTERNGID